MLNVVVENSGSVSVVHCSGRIVEGQTSPLYNAVTSLKNARVVLLDLAGVSGMDARGLGVLLALMQWARNTNVRLQVVASNVVQELLDLTRLGPQFELLSTEDFVVDSRETKGMGVAADDCTP